MDIEEIIDDTVTTATAVSQNFILKWIRFENFRRFKDAELTLDSEGVIGITGENGAGKSSFMIGLIFALYGKLPDDVRKAGLRHRGSDPKKDPTVVSVGFEHHGQTVEVVRKLSGGNHTATAEIFLDGKQVTVATGSTATDWVTNRLGMDAEGFKTAVVVPQSELTRLVTSRPAERREIIEKLAGIEDMNKAVKNARAQENDLSKIVKILPGDPDVVEALDEEIADLEADVSGLQARGVQLSADADTYREKRNTINAELVKHRGVLDAHQSASRAVGNAKHQVELKQMEKRNLQEAIASIRDRYPDTDVPDKGTLEAKVAELRGQYKEIAAKIKDFYAQESRLGSTVQGLDRRIQETGSRLEAEQRRLDGITQELGSINLEALSSESSSISDLTVEQKSVVSNSRAKRAEMQDAIATLRKHEHDAHCPTCSQSLADPEALIRSFEEVVSNYTQQGKDAEAKIAELTRQAQSISTRIDKARTLTQEKSRVEESVNRLTRERADDVEAHRAATEELKGLAGVPVQEWEQRQKSISDQGAEVAQQIQQIDATRKALTELSDKENQLAVTESALRSLQDALTNAENDLDAFGDIAGPQEQVAFYGQELPGVESHLEGVNAELSRVRSEESAKVANLSHAKEKKDAEERLIQQKQDKLQELSILTATTSLLDDFRKDRISRIAPELSSTATEMISMMTDGAFVEVAVAEDFSTTVTNHKGETFSVSEVSGGERSIVALCLRIAISSLISNENSGLMWLDEAFTEQDAKRRASILNVLNSLPIQQIIMINHTHDAEDIVDKTIKVSRDEEASTVEQ